MYTADEMIMLNEDSARCEGDGDDSRYMGVANGKVFLFLEEKQRRHHQQQHQLTRTTPSSSSSLLRIGRGAVELESSDYNNATGPSRVIDPLGNSSRGGASSALLTFTPGDTRTPPQRRGPLWAEDASNYYDDDTGSGGRAHRYRHIYAADGGDHHPRCERELFTSDDTNEAEEETGYDEDPYVRSVSYSLGFGQHTSVLSFGFSDTSRGTTTPSTVHTTRGGGGGVGTAGGMNDQHSSGEPQPQQPQGSPLGTAHRWGAAGNTEDMDDLFGMDAKRSPVRTFPVFSSSMFDGVSGGSMMLSPRATPPPHINTNGEAVEYADTSLGAAPGAVALRFPSLGLASPFQLPPSTMERQALDAIFDDSLSIRDGSGAAVMTFGAIDGENSTSKAHTSLNDTSSTTANGLSGHTKDIQYYHRHYQQPQLNTSVRTPRSTWTDCSEPQAPTAAAVAATVTPSLPAPEETRVTYTTSHPETGTTVATAHLPMATMTTSLRQSYFTDASIPPFLRNLTPVRNADNDLLLVNASSPNGGLAVATVSLGGGLQSPSLAVAMPPAHAFSPATHFHGYSSRLRSSDFASSFGTSTAASIGGVSTGIAFSPLHAASTTQRSSTAPTVRLLSSERTLSADGVVLRENMDVLHWGCFGLIVVLGRTAYIWQGPEKIHTIFRVGFGVQVTAVASSLVWSDGGEEVFIAFGLSSGRVEVQRYARCSPREVDSTSSATMSSDGITYRLFLQSNPSVGVKCTGKKAFSIYQHAVTSLQIVDHTLYIGGVEGVLLALDLLYMEFPSIERSIAAPVVTAQQMQPWLQQDRTAAEREVAVASVEQSHHSSSDASYATPTRQPPQQHRPHHHHHHHNIPSMHQGSRMFAAGTPRPSAAATIVSPATTGAQRHGMRPPIHHMPHSMHMTATASTLAPTPASPQRQPASPSLTSGGGDSSDTGGTSMDLLDSVLAAPHCLSLNVGEPIIRLEVTDDHEHIAVGTNTRLLVYHVGQLMSSHVNSTTLSTNPSPTTPLGGGSVTTFNTTTSVLTNGATAATGKLAEPIVVVKLSGVPSNGTTRGVRAFGWLHHPRHHQRRANRDDGQPEGGNICSGSSHGGRGGVTTASANSPASTAASSSLSPLLFSSVAAVAATASSASLLAPGSTHVVLSAVLVFAVGEGARSELRVFHLGRRKILTTRRVGRTIHSVVCSRRTNEVVVCAAPSVSEEGLKAEDGYFTAASTSATYGQLYLHSHRQQQQQRHQQRQQQQQQFIPSVHSCSSGYFLLAPSLHHASRIGQPFEHADPGMTSGVARGGDTDTEEDFGHDVCVSPIPHSPCTASLDGDAPSHASEASMMQTEEADAEARAVTGTPRHARTSSSFSAASDLAAGMSHFVSSVMHVPSGSHLHPYAQQRDGETRSSNNNFHTPHRIVTAAQARGVATHVASALIATPRAQLLPSPHTHTTPGREAEAAVRLMARGEVVVPSTTGTATTPRPFLFASSGSPTSAEGSALMVFELADGDEAHRGGGGTARDGAWRPQLRLRGASATGLGQDMVYATLSPDGSALTTCGTERVARFWFPFVSLHPHEAKRGAGSGRWGVSAAAVVVGGTDHGHSPTAHLTLDQQRYLALASPTGVRESYDDDSTLR